MVESTELLTVKQVAEELKVGEWTVGEWIRSGQLEAHRLGYRTTRVARGDLTRFLEARRNANGNGH